MALIDFFGGGNLSGNSSTNSLFSNIKDSVGNYVTKAQRTYIPTTQEALLVAGKNDEFATMIRVDRKGNILTGNYLPYLNESFEGATVNVQKWTATSTTWVPAQATLTGYNLNSTNLTTTTTGSMLVSQRLFYKMQRVPMQFKTRLRHSAVANSIVDFGFGSPTNATTLIVSNGAQFRITSSATIKGFITINGVEVASGNIVSQVESNGNTVGGNLNMSNAYYTAGYFVYDIVVDDDNVVFTVQDTSTGELLGKLSLAVPASQYKMWGATAVPCYIRGYNSGTPASAPTVIYTDITVLGLDMGIQPNASQVAGQLSMSAGRNPFTGAQTENHTNSTAPTSATLSNTAAGYTTLGGKWQFAAVAGAVTDYALFGFQVPAGSTFQCEGITINTRNTGSAVATTATTLEWAMGFNSSAVSLATANIVRRQVGIQSFAIATAAEVVAPTIDVEFVTPEVVESGRFVHVILTMPVGSATPSQIIRGTCMIKGRFI